jgi:hypothetical protein
MSDLQELAYLLRHDLERFNHIERGEGYDVQAFSFNGVTQVREADEDKLLTLPAPTFFYQHKRPEYLRKLDSFYAQEGCPIFSQRMIDTLLSVKEFSYRKYPIAILEERGAIDPYEDVEKFKKLSLRDDLFIFQVLEALDIFDWDKSEYSKYEEEDTMPDDVDRYVLKVPEGGLPPIFRILYPPNLQSVQLFVSREAREALGKSEITGVAFGTLSRPWGNSEVDVPVEDPSDADLDREVEQHRKKIERVFAEAERWREQGDDDRADRIEQKAHDLMRDIGY